MKKVLITGANGQLGSEIKLLASDLEGYEFDFTDVAELDLTNEETVNQYVSQAAPCCIINCAAYTAVDKAESDVEMARKINALAPSFLAKAATANGCQLIHVSTDYVFDGTAHVPYVEETPTSPNSVYGETKLEGEQLVEKYCKEHVIVRTSWLYSAFGNNFVKTMLRLGNERDELGVIFDQIGTPTYARDLAVAVLKILEKLQCDDSENVLGVYHFSNEGVCSWYDFATEIFRQERVNCQVKPIETIEYPTPAKRPHYSVMNKRKIKNAFELTIPHWTESLSDCLTQLKAK